MTWRHVLPIWTKLKLHAYHPLCRLCGLLVVVVVAKFWVRQRLSPFRKAACVSLSKLHSHGKSNNSLNEQTGWLMLQHLWQLSGLLRQLMCLIWSKISLSSGLPWVSVDENVQNKTWLGLIYFYVWEHPMFLMLFWYIGIGVCCRSVCFYVCMSVVWIWGISVVFWGCVIHVTNMCRWDYKGLKWRCSFCH